jgi:hypothetical protein
VSPYFIAGIPRRKREVHPNFSGMFPPQGPGQENAEDVEIPGT